MALLRWKELQPCTEVALAALTAHRSELDKGSNQWLIRRGGGKGLGQDDFKFGTMRKNCYFPVRTYMTFAYCDVDMIRPHQRTQKA